MYRLSDAQGEKDLTKPLVELPKHSGSVYSLASNFVPQHSGASTLLASGADVDVALWSVDSNEDRIHSETDPSTLSSRGHAGQPPAQKRAKQHRDANNNNRGAVFDNDREEGGKNAPRVRLLWRAEHPREKLSAGGLGSLVETNGLCFHSAGLVSASGDGVVRLWDVERGSVVSELARHTGAAHCVTTLYNTNGSNSNP